MAFYKKRIVREDTPADIQERIASRFAHDTALAATKAAFPVLTADNFAEANAFREQQIKVAEGRYDGA